MCEQVRDGEMPLPAYLVLHGEARLTAADVATLCRWTEAAQATLPPLEGEAP
jgi:hypothetical protein